ncbi:hypothetical protein AAVH_35335, partial [Aphelenchoides avenae]
PWPCQGSTPWHAVSCWERVREGHPRSATEHRRSLELPRLGHDPGRGRLRHHIRRSRREELRTRCEVPPDRRQDRVQPQTRRNAPWESEVDASGKRYGEVRPWK